jgi:hypothetical protein
MKFKEGDKVTVLRVPLRAKQYGVIPGMYGHILPTDDSEEEKHAVALGLVKIQIHDGFHHGPHFWWKATDLALGPSKWISDAIAFIERERMADYAAMSIAADGNQGYDPYNSIDTRWSGVRYGK